MRSIDEASRDLPSMTDDELRAAIREHGLRAEWVGEGRAISYEDEVCRRNYLLALLRGLYRRAFQADQRAHVPVGGRHLATPSPGTEVVRAEYRRQLDNWVAGSPDLISTEDARPILGVPTRDAAGKKLRRWGVQPVIPDALYERRQVVAEQASSRGRGNWAPETRRRAPAGSAGPLTWRPSTHQHGLSTVHGLDLIGQDGEIVGRIWRDRHTTILPTITLRLGDRLYAIPEDHIGIEIQDAGYTLPPEQHLQLIEQINSL